MNTLFSLTLFGYFLVFLTSCQFSSQGKKPEITNNSSKNELKNQSLENMILSLPKFKYHESSVEYFRKSVMSARNEVHNIGGSKNYLYLIGDGSYPAQDFTWNQSSQTLVVKSVGDGIDPGQIDVWHMNHENLEIIK